MILALTIGCIPLIPYMDDYSSIHSSLKLDYMCSKRCPVKMVAIGVTYSEP
jgi:hypothetical protein